MISLNVTQLGILFYNIYFILYLLFPNIFLKEFIYVYSFLFLSKKIIESKFNFNVLLIASILTLWSVFIFIYRDYFYYGSLIPLILVNTIFALTYLNNKIGVDVQKILILIFLFIILIKTLLGIDSNHILANRSRNMVGFYFLFYIIFYYIEDYRYNKNITIWPSILNILVSIMMIGRSNIIVGLLLLLFIIYIKFRSNRKILVTFFVFIIISYLCLGNILINKFERFNEYGFELTGREIIYDEYLTLIQMNIENFIFGFSLETLNFNLFDKNLHNSFLSIHYFFGFVSFFIIISLIYILLNRSISLFMKGLLMILLIRAFSDQILFLNFSDIIIIYLILLMLKMGRKGKKWKKK